MSKNTFEQIAAQQLTDPAYDPQSDDKKSLEGVPVTEPNQADLSSSGITVLGSYLNSYTTSGRRQNGTGNEFYPSWEASEAPSLNRPTGKKEIQKEGKSFLQQDDNAKISSDAFFDTKDLEDLLSKDGSKESPSGNELLRSVEGNDHPLVRAVLDKLTKDNVYTPEKHTQFIKDNGTTNEEIATRGLFTIQRDLGSFILDGKQGKNESSGRRVQVSDMSKMALALLAQSVGNYTAAGSIMENGTISFLSRNLANPVEQLGIQGVSVDRLRLSGLYSSNPDIRRLIDGAKGQNDLITTQNQTNLNNRGISSDGGTDPKLQSSAYNSVSHSQLNSFMAPFGGLVGSAGMLTIAIEGVLGLLAISLLLSALPKGETKDYIDPESPWLYGLGSHRKNETTGATTILYDLLRITDTDYDFKSCVETGILLLLGFNPSVGKTGLKAALSNPASLGVFAANLALTPSYYANLFRQITRDTNDVVAGFREIGGTYSSGLTSIAAAIDKLVNSKAYQFVMMAAGVGDAALKSINGQLDMGTTNVLLQNQDIVPEQLEDKSSKSFRALGDWRRHVSRWSGGRNPLSLHTFPAAIVRQTETAGKHTAIRSYKKPSRDEVESIENDLDAEYMPFYFHDLRTHEIISLPAFITQFDESFNVTYNSNIGYGRQDPVRIYDNTERSMSFGFKLVAFNKEDFDEMWFMVNKLVAMCYPQYSKGRERQFSENETEYKFTQPFSQVPAASPMIRLRLGDVLKSNYSLSSAKKLFGDLSIEAATERNEYEVAKANNIEKARKKFEADKLGTMFEYGKLKDPTKTFPYASLGGRRKATWPDYAVVNFVPASFAGKFNLGSIIPGTKDNQRDVIAKSTTGSGWDIIKVTAADIAFDVASAKKAISADVEAAKAKLDAKLKLIRAPTNTQQSDFFRPENNAIIRSFNSTRGKGLAGVITSLAFDYGTYPYEITPGSRAPKMIDVSLGFAPIHDLPLGLDYKGELRAPSHPVGGIAGDFGDVYDDVPPSAADLESVSSQISDLFGSNTVAGQETMERLSKIAKGPNDKSKGA